MCRINIGNQKLSWSETLKSCVGQGEGRYVGFKVTGNASLASSGYRISPKLKFNINCSAEKTFCACVAKKNYRKFNNQTKKITTSRLQDSWNHDEPSGSGCWHLHDPVCLHWNSISWSRISVLENTVRLATPARLLFPVTRRILTRFLKVKYNESLLESPC